MTSSIYLAYPIDLVSNEELRTVLNQARMLLRGAGFMVYDPGQAMSVHAAAEPSPVINRINRAALAQVDALVAIYPELPSIGVPMEMEWAREHQLPVLVVSRAAGQSWALAQAKEDDGFMVHSRLTSRVVVQLQERISLRKYQTDLAQHSAPKQSVFITVEPGAQPPTQSHPGDAGFDLYCLGDHLIGPGQFMDVPTGIRAQLPAGSWAMITGRSSTIRKYNLLVSTGIIDGGYRGPLFAAVTNLSTDQSFQVKDGMRLAQLLPFPNLADRMEMTITRELSPSERGEAGFGSSGE